MLTLNARVRREAGASLIEVLVAILVVSLGVVAMGGLLAAATRLGKASEIRAVASLLASDISDRMKANAGAVRTSNYNLATAFSATATEPAAPTGCIVTDACTAEEIAAADLAAWRRALYHSLPLGQGYVAYDSGASDAGGAVDVWVAWLDPKALSDGAFQDVDDANAKTCPPGFATDTAATPRCMYFRVAL